MLSREALSAPPERPGGKGLKSSNYYFSGLDVYSSFPSTISTGKSAVGKK